MAPGKNWTLIVPFLQSLSSRNWDIIESHTIKVVPFLHVSVSSTLPSDFFELECALSWTVKSLHIVNVLAFSISALNWSMVLSIVSTRWRLASLSGAVIGLVQLLLFFLHKHSNVRSITVIFVYGRQIRGVSSSADKIEIDKFIITIFIRCFLVCCFLALWISFGTVIVWTNIKLSRIYVEEIIVGGFIS